MSIARQRGDSQAGLTLIEVLISLIILSIISTMLVVGWINLQRASATAVRTNNARATARDAMSRISSELRGAQPTSLPVATLPGEDDPILEPPLTMAAPMEVRFSSAFNSSGANADGSGLAALRPTRLWLDTGTVPSAPWNPQNRTLYLQRDMNGNGSFTDAADRSIMLARNVANTSIPDAGNGPSGTTYTPVFRYAYRPAGGGAPLWTDNAAASLDLSSVVAISVRLIINKKMGGAPSYVDLTTTVRLRNASSD